MPQSVVFTMEDGSHQSDRVPKTADETSLFLSPRKRRQPMTYFLYPGLDAPDLKEFLMENQASTACIRKALGDLGRLTPSPSVQNLSGSLSGDNMSSISDEVFIDDVVEMPEEQNVTQGFDFSLDTLLDDVPLENPADDTEATIQNSSCNHEPSSKTNGTTPAKKRKGLSKLLVSLCACGGFKNSKHKLSSSPTTEL